MEKEMIMTCPKCKNEIWDMAQANKLFKCWGCKTAFMPDEGDEVNDVNVPCTKEKDNK